jgi:hypothetical protein
MMTTIKVLEVKASEMFAGLSAEEGGIEGAVDARVTLDGAEYAVTLCPAQYDGTLSAWGARDNWIAGDDIYSLTVDQLSEIEVAVRDAAARL